MIVYGIIIAINIIILFINFKTRSQRRDVSKVLSEYNHVVSVVFEYYKVVPLSNDLTRREIFIEYLNSLPCGKFDYAQYVHTTSHIMELYKHDIPEFKNKKRNEAITTLLG